MKRILLCFMVFLCAYNTQAATCIASTGLYSAAGTWSCGHIPADNDAVGIPAGVTVTVDMTTAVLSNCNFYVYGTLSFNNAQKIKLACNSSITIYAGGQLVGGNGGSKVEYCGDPNAWQGPGQLAGPAGIGNTPLPIELVDFIATFQSGEHNVELSWSTASEINNDFFTIEACRDGLNFEPVAQVNGAGNSISLLKYAYTDDSFGKDYEGIRYYRLKQTDFNGVYTYSSIKSVNITGKPYLVFPNPSFNGDFTLQVDNADVTLFNYMGQAIMDEKVLYKKAFHIEESGFYLLRINKGGQVYNVGVINSRK